MTTAIDLAVGLLNQTGTAPALLLPDDQEFVSVRLPAEAYAQGPARALLEEAAPTLAVGGVAELVAALRAA